MGTEDKVIDEKVDEKLGEPGLKALEAVKGENKTLKEQLAQFKDVDPLKYRELVTASEQAEADRLKKAGEFDTLTKQEQEKTTAAEKGRLEALAELSQSKVETAFDRAFATVKGFPESSEVVFAYAQRHLKYDPESKTVQVIDPATGEARTKDGKPVTVFALLEELRADPKTARNFAAAEPVKGAGMGTGAGRGRQAAVTGAGQSDGAGQTPTERVKEFRRSQ